MITEASFIPITPKKIPENFFSLIEKLSDTSKYLIYRVDVMDFSSEHWNKTKEIYENKGGKVILNSRLAKNISDHESLHLTSRDLIKTNQLGSSTLPDWLPLRLSLFSYSEKSHSMLSNSSESVLAKPSTANLLTP